MLAHPHPVLSVVVLCWEGMIYVRTGCSFISGSVLRIGSFFSLGKGGIVLIASAEIERPRRWTIAYAAQGTCDPSPHDLTHCRGDN